MGLLYIIMLLQFGSFYCNRILNLENITFDAEIDLVRLSLVYRRSLKSMSRTLLRSNCPVIR